jgi:POT family proton-dependent oligopeptide transporter
VTQQNNGEVSPSETPSKARADAAGAAWEMFAGQPSGLWVLFITEMWERFSYYGMRALFVLFLIASTAPLLPTGKPDATEPAVKNNEQGSTESAVPSEEGAPNWNPGFGWKKADAYTLYGVYTFMVYLTAIFGGMIADRLLGTHRSMLVGGVVIALGHICLAGMALFPHELGVTVSLEHGSGALISFLIGCTLIIIGTGFFKPCVSVMVGQLYRRGDPRRESGFTIFYMGINLGAFLSPLVAGSLAKFVGWHWGFGAAAAGMILGLLFYVGIRNRFLSGIGDPPPEPLSWKARAFVLSAVTAMIATPVVPLIVFISGGLDWVTSVWSGFTSTVGVYGLAALITGAVVIASALFLLAQPGKDRGPLAVILILAFIGNIFFWTAFEQAGSSLNVFAEESTDRTLFGLLKSPGFPAEYYQSVNPLTILIFAWFFAWLWLYLERKQCDPSSPMKFAIGLWLLGLAFLAMVFGAMQAEHGNLAGPHWLLITYVVYTWGELCLSPVGLSMVTKLAPKRLQSLMMGLWFFTFALSNLLAGLVARFSTKFVPEEAGAKAEWTFILPGLPGFFLMLVVVPLIAGTVIAVLTPVLKRMMRGVE